MSVMDFGKKVLTKTIRGQVMMPAPRHSFKYGQLAEVSPMTFEFVHSFGGYGGAPLQTPPEGRAWIKSAFHPLCYEVSLKDLDGNYKDKED